MSTKRDTQKTNLFQKMWISKQECTAIANKSEQKNMNKNLVHEEIHVDEPNNEHNERPHRTVVICCKMLHASNRWSKKNEKHQQQQQCNDNGSVATHNAHNYSRFSANIAENHQMICMHLYWMQRQCNRANNSEQIMNWIESIKMLVVRNMAKERKKWRRRRRSLILCELACTIVWGSAFDFVCSAPFTVALQIISRLHIFVIFIGCAQSL